MVAADVVGAEADAVGAEEKAITTLPGLSLADAAQWKADCSFTEGDMQPVVMKVLSAVGPAVGCNLNVVDTHEKCDLRSPYLEPGCTLFSAGVQTWSTVGVYMEFKLHTEARQEMVGQVVQRSAGKEDGEAQKHSASYAVGASSCRGGCWGAWGVGVACPNSAAVAMLLQRQTYFYYLSCAVDALQPL